MEPKLKPGTRIRTLTAKGKFPAGSLGTVTKPSPWANGDELTVKLDAAEGDWVSWFFTPDEVEVVEPAPAMVAPPYTVGQRVRGTGKGLSTRRERGVVTKIKIEDGTVYVDILTDAGDTLEGFHASELTLDLPDYVGVQVGGRTYSYIDPSGKLEIGDRVLVPFGKNVECVGKVVEGRSGYFDCKSVSAKLVVEEL